MVFNNEIQFKSAKSDANRSADVSFFTYHSCANYVVQIVQIKWLNGKKYHTLLISTDRCIPSIAIAQAHIKWLISADYVLVYAYAHEAQYVT